MYIILRVILLYIALSIFSYANENCYELIPRMKVLNENQYIYSASLTKEIFNDENKILCLTQKDLNTYYQKILKYFVDVEGYYIPPIVEVKYPKENSRFYGDFLVEFQKVNDIIFEGKGKNTFLKYLIHLSVGDEFKTEKILKDQEFFNSLTYLKLDGFDIQKTDNGKFNAVYNMGQDAVWLGAMSLSNSQSEAYNSYGDLSSFLSFDFFNPTGMAWHYNLSASSSRLHSKSSSYKEYFSANVTVPYKAFRLTAQLSKSNNVVESNSIDVRLINKSFYQGKSTSQSYSLAYNTTLATQLLVGVSTNMKFDQYRNYSFVNSGKIVGGSVKDNNNYTTFAGLIDASFSHPNIYISGEIKYSQLLSKYSTIKVEKVYYDMSRYYKTDYGYFNYSLSTYVPFSTWGNYSMYVFGQYTNEVLRDIEKFGAGDRNSVRGYGNNFYLSSDSGYFVRNDITILIDDWIHPYIAYDYASLTPTVKNMFDIDKAKFSGGAIGVKGVMYDVQYDLFIGKPLNNKISNVKNEYTMGYSLNYKF